MKKILIASYNLDFGGIEKSLVNLLNNIDYNKYDVTLVLEDKRGVFLNNIPKNVRILEYKVSNNKFILVRKIKNMFKRINWLIKNHNKYDSSICYATYSGPCGFVARTSSKNKVLFVHSNYYQTYDKNVDRVTAFLRKIKIKKYNHIVFVSNESMKDVCSVYPAIKDKSCVINNIINQEEIIKQSKDSINVDKGNKKVFTFVGRLDESSKKLSILLDVAQKAKNASVNAMFWIIGSGPDEKMYKSIVKNNKLDNVVFFGAKKNPYPYIKMSDYVILTSKYEGFPVIYNEAIILGKPIITTIDVSDDYININNRFGYVVTENEVFNKVKELSNKTEKLKEQIDYNILNNKRIKKIESVLENNYEI